MHAQMPLESANVERLIFNKFLCRNSWQFRHMEEMMVEGLRTTEVNVVCLSCIVQTMPIYN